MAARGVEIMAVGTAVVDSLAHASPCLLLLWYCWGSSLLSTSVFLLLARYIMESTPMMGITTDSDSRDMTMMADITDKMNCSASVSCYLYECPTRVEQALFSVALAYLCFYNALKCRFDLLILPSILPLMKQTTIPSKPARPQIQI